MEDINAILKKAQSGDSEAIDLILKEYSRLLSFNAQKYYLVGAEKEDLVQEGILGLLKAIKFYDETKSSFSSFAFLCIRREMISAIRKANTQKHMVLNEALKTNAILEDSANFDDEEHNINNYKSSESNPEEAYLLKEEIEEFKKFSENNFSKFELHLDLLYKGTVKFSKEHDTLKKMDNVVFKWGVKDGSEIVKLEPKLKQIGLINFTKKMAKILPFSKKIFIPLLWIVNNRLGMYTYNK